MCSIQSWRANYRNRFLSRAHDLQRSAGVFFFCWIPSEKAIKKVKCFVNRTEHESIFISAGEMTLRLLTAAGYSWPIVVLFWPSPYISRTEMKFRAVTHLIIWSSDPITADKRAICLKHKKDLKKIWSTFDKFLAQTSENSLWGQVMWQQPQWGPHLSASLL